MPIANHTVAAILAGAAGGGYAFRKTNTVPRVYYRGGTGSAANSSSWVSGQTNTSGFITSHVCIDAEAPFTAVYLVFGNLDAVSYPISGISVAPGATLNDLTNSTDAGRQNFIAGTMGGLSTGTVPAAVSGNAGMLVSDRIPVTSMTRQAGDATTWSVSGGKLADSYTRPLLHIRVAQPITAAATPLLGQPQYGGNGGTTDGPFNPAQPTITGRWASVKNASDTTVQTSVGAATALTGTTYGPFSGIINMPIIGVIFEYTVNAMSAAADGDSITAGAGIGHDGSGDVASPASGSSRSWARVGTEPVSTMAHPIEFCFLALAGQHTDTFEQYFENMVANGVIPTHAIHASFSPNDTANGPGAPQLATLNKFLTTCGTYNIYPMTWTGAPVGLLAGQKMNTTGEAARLSWNASMRAGTLTNNAKGQPVDYFEIDQYVYNGQKLSDDGAGDPTNHIASFNNSPVVIGDLRTTLNLHPNYSGDKLWFRASYSAKLTSLAASYFAT